MMKRSTVSLLGGCASIIALAVAGAPSVAQTQMGFQGSVVGMTGDPVINPDNNSVSVTNSQTVIDWRPSDTSGTGAIDFLPEGQIASFNNGMSGGPAYTVLNRILPVDGNSLPVSRIIGLNGTVQSGSEGSIWFYSPGGIVAGANSVFNVGSLVLTSNDIDVTGGLYGANGEIRFRGVTGNGAVEISPNAQINALAPGSYVALVAPRVVQSGTVTVNGTAAYVGAEQVDFQITTGLYDLNITVLAGTTDANGVVHDGTTARLPSSDPSATAQRVYMVAVPKNSALTMLLSGNVSYAAADSVITDNGSVILAAGHDVSGTIIGAQNMTTTSASNVSLGEGIWQRRVTARATGDIAVQPGAGTNAQFDSDLVLTGANVRLQAGPQSAITIGGNMQLSAGTGAAGGHIDLLTFGGSGDPATNGRIDVTGMMTLYANGNGFLGSSSQPAIGTDATGGIINIIAAGGDISAASLSADASAIGGNGSDRSGDATGGAITLTASTATGPSGLERGSLNFGDMTLNASAGGFSQFSTPPVTGGNARGGTINIGAAGGSISSNSLSAYASASGSEGSDRSGDATGGGITLTASTATGPSATERGSLSIDSLFLDASADGYRPYFTQPVTGGNAMGGTISIGAAGGSFSAAQIDLDVSASGSEASGVAGTGTGGGITLFSSAADGQRGSFALTDCGLYYCNAYAGGEGASGAEGAAGTGGSVLLYTSDGDFSAPGVLAFSADGVGGLGGSDGAAGRGAEGRGGNLTVEARQGAAGTGLLSLGELRLTAAGSSGENIDGPSLNAGNAGNGVGGTINLSVLGGTLTADRLDLDASAVGGAAEVNCPDCTGGGTTPFQAGTGQGGTASFLISGGSATIGQLNLNASGMGGEAAAADLSFDPQAVGALAGTGRGGTASLTSSGGVLNLTDLSIDASGRGGEGLSAFQGSGANGGAGVGGMASLLMTAGSAGQLRVDGNLTVQASGTGGDGGRVGDFGAATDGAGRGGDGTGGIAEVMLAGGALTAPSLLVAAGGTGGSGGEHGSDGIGGAAGNGTGGTARLSYRNEGHAIGSLAVSAEGRGGEAGSSRRFLDYDSNDVPIYSYDAGGGGTGGAGTGGTADLLIDVDPAFSSLTVSADGFGSMGGSGGIGGAGGTGAGGTATLNILFGATTVSGPVRVSAFGQGGLGGSGYSGAGGRGGDAFGGTATFGLAGASTTLDAGAIMVLAEALGGDGGASGLSGGAGIDGADGGQATGGAALMTVTSGARATSAEGLRISGNATGGAGSGGTGGMTGGQGGSGGAAQAGSARLQIDGGHFASAGNSPQPASHAITAIGQGGSGAAGSDGSDPGTSGGLGGNAGNGVGGLAAFQAVDGDYALASLNLVADGYAGLAGAGGNGPGGGSAAGLTGVGSGGTASLSNGGAAAATGLRSLDLLYMSASGDVAGRVQLADSSTGANGGLRVTGPAALFSTGTTTAGFSGVYASGSGNRVRMGSAQLISDGPLSFVFSGGAGWTIDGALTGNAASNISVDHAGRTAGSDSLFADSIVFNTPGAISLTSAASLGTVDRLTLLSQGGNIDLASGTALNAGGDIRLFAQGSLNGAGATVSAVGSVAIGLGGNGDIRLGTLASGGPLDQANNEGLALGAGGLVTGGTIQIGNATTGGGMALTGQGVDVQNLTSGGPTLLNAGTGDLRVGNILSAGAINAFGRNVTLGSTGTMTIADAVASGSMTLNAATLNAANLSAGAALTASATGLATLSGLIAAPTIAISSGDIAIGSGAQIGNGSGSVTFNAINLQRSAMVGGDDAAGSYSLSGAELGRVTASAITVHAASQPVAGAPDLIVRDLTMGSANLASGGILTLSAAGRLRVEGAVQLTGRSGTGGLTLAAGEAVEVIAGSGSVAIGNANGGLGGVLTLSSPRVFAATLAAIADVSAASSLAARELRLAQNDGVTIDAGMLRAGSIIANVTDGLYIQNVGLSTDFADRRGFTANDFSIATGGQRPAIVINGQLLLSSGAMATGRDVLPLVAVGGYAAGSKINGCLIGTGGACLTPVFDSRDTWEATVDPAVTVGRVFNFSLIELRDIVAQGYPPLIDEPVTGAGNEDLWERSCGGPDEAACGD